MIYDWGTRSSDIEKFIYELKEESKKILKENFTGFYIHGSLAMGGFNPKSSDIDILIITFKTVKADTKRLPAQFLLNHSNRPFPIEISFLNKEQLRNWQHPCSFDFHYSEFWRERYQSDLLKGTSFFLNDNISTDTDLAAHITIINHRGICVEGKPIRKIFPSVPRLDYKSSILNDFEDCLQNVNTEPIYCTLNMIRVYWYLKEGVISSKLEAGNWSCIALPQYFSESVKRVVNIYTGEGDLQPLNVKNIIFLKEYLDEKIKELLQ